MDKYIFNLPSEIIVYIIEFLSPKDYNSLVKTCNYFYSYSISLKKQKKKDFIKIKYYEDEYKKIIWNEYPNGWKTGKQTEYIKIADDRMLIMYVCNFKKGKPHGKYKEYHTSHQFYTDDMFLRLKKECIYKNGLLNGTHLEWDKNGILISQARFINNQRVHYVVWNNEDNNDGLNIVSIPNIDKLYIT